MRFHSLVGWLQWQDRLHPTAIELGLERVARVWAELRPRGLQCHVVTVGGTNGKGSCVAMTSAIAEAAGYRTGCYTSPHLMRYNERIRIDGKQVTDEVLCGAFDRVDRARGDISLTYFEFGTLAALDLFAAASPDLVILEVGLGGRLDAVNIVDADIALVTTIGLDHTAWLGADLDSIAREKAGIFRPGRPAVIGQANAPEALEKAARETGAQVFLAHRDYKITRRDPYWDWHGPDRARRGLPRPALRGSAQVDNAAAVLTVLDCLSGDLPVGQDAVRNGLLDVRLPGRLQVLPGDVTFILDVAHNPQAARNLARDLESIPSAGKTHAVYGCLQDKDAAAFAGALSGLVHDWHLCALDDRRAMEPMALRGSLTDSGIGAPISSHRSIESALDCASAQAVPGDRVLVTGSFLTVAAAMRHLSLDSA